MTKKIPKRERIVPQPPRKQPGWKRQQSAVARERGGEIVKGSGNGARKGDARTKLFLDEQKTTQHRSIYVTLPWLEKITEEARSEGKHPSLTFGFDRDIRVDWTAAPLAVFALLEKIALAVIHGDLAEAQALAEKL